MNLIKIIAINLILFAILLLLINWACGVHLRNESEQRGREELPNFKDQREHAKKIFAEYHQVKHRYEPFAGWRALPYSGETTTISEQGLRIHAKPSPAGSRKKIISFYGGSTAWGEGSDDQHTIPALVSKNLPEYEVINQGQLAYTSRQELDALISAYSKDVKPHIVVFYDGVNDAAFLCPEEIRELPAHRLVPVFQQKIYSSKPAVVKGLVSEIFIGNILKVTAGLSGRSAENSPYDCISKPGKAEEIAEIMIRNWEIAHEIVTTRGGKFIAVLQPGAFTGKARTDHLKLDEDLGKNFRAVYEQIKKKISERNLPWIFDLTDKFDGNEYIYIDFCHVSPNGNAIMADEIAGIIKNQEK